MTAGGVLPDSVAMIMGMARLYEEGQMLPTKSKAEEMERSRVQELAVAFIGGWAFLAVVLHALHRLGRRRPPSDESPLE